MLRLGLVHWEIVCKIKIQGERMHQGQKFKQLRYIINERGAEKMECENKAMNERRVLENTQNTSE